MPHITRRISSEHLNVHEAWRAWKQAFCDVSDAHAPLRTIRAKNRHNPWMTGDLLSLMYERDRVKKKALKTKNTVIWEQYKLLRNQVVHNIKQAQRSYYKEQVDVNSGNKTAMWKALRHILGSPTRSVPNNISPEAFNSYFTGIGTKLADRLDNVPYSSSLPRAIHSFELQSISVDFIYDQLLLLKDQSNNDIINIDSKMMKIGSSAIAPSLTMILNLSISSGELPSDWKCAKVTPIYKGKGASDDCGNYRPISVISHVSKIMEKVVLFQLKEYLSCHSFITPSQSAFINNYSTSTAVQRVISEVLEGFNENEITTMCFIDLQKMF
jgi:hypothetical protein